MDATVLPPATQIHLAAALTALLLGPAALTARKGTRWHRAAGYAWVTSMLGAAFSSLFMRSALPVQWLGFSWIHLLTLLTFAGLGYGIWAVAHGHISAHRRIMWSTYIGGCLVAGAFTLLPGRYLGQMVWGDWLGLL